MQDSIGHSWIFYVRKASLETIANEVIGRNRRKIKDFLDWIPETLICRHRAMVRPDIPEYQARRCPGGIP